MRADVHLHEYRILASTGELLGVGICEGVKGAWSVLVEKTSVKWSYQIAHRALRNEGVWVAHYLPATSPEILHLVVVQRLPSDEWPPP